MWNAATAKMKIIGKDIAVYKNSYDDYCRNMEWPAAVDLVIEKMAKHHGMQVKYARRRECT